MSNPFNKENVNPHWMSLVFSLSQAAMAQMGKVSNPATGTLERDLDAAKVSIDLLRMLHEKTKGNLTSEEDRILTSLLTDLELNYADEAAKEKPAVQETATPKEQKIFPGK